MASGNVVILLGNLTRDPQSRQVNAASAVVEWGMAWNEKRRDANGNEIERVVFADCSAWGRTGEIVAEYCHKGDQLFVSGGLKFDQWDDRNGGGKRSKLSIGVEFVQLMDNRHRRDGGEGSGASSEQFGGYQRTQPQRRNDTGPTTPQGTAAQAGYRQNARQPAPNAPQRTGRPPLDNRPSPPQNAPRGNVTDGNANGGYDPTSDLDMGELENRFDERHQPAPNRATPKGEPPTDDDIPF